MKIGTQLFARKKNRRTLDRIQFATVLGEHAVYRGDLTGEANYLVKGQVRGRCEIVGHLVLQQTASWNGNISATHVVIAGEVNGDVHASAKLELQSTARIRGDISSPVIALAQGAQYEGAIRRRPSAQVTQFTEKRSG